MKKIIHLILLFLLLISLSLFSKVIGATKINNTGYKGKSYVDILPDKNILSESVPEARYDHTAVWTGEKMIIWGGYPKYRNNGGIFNPSDSTWQIISSNNSPAGREDHTAIWTGEKMIIWGGSGSLSDTYYNDINLYDPSNNTWQKKSSGDAPSGRMWHTTIWTGEKMIIWGGWGYYGNLNDGKIYDLSTDTWQSISTENAPSKRHNHTAVWTGDKMIVWGGYDVSANYFNDGYIYDPSTNTWQAISTDGAPSVRQYHTAVWTGDKMIVWGGRDNNGNLNDGKIYNPSTNTWQAMSMDSAPLRRRYHTTIWTGEKMIVWGGRGDNGVLNDGNAYNPSTDTWQTISTDGAPLGRNHHSEIWTGDKMIVWGGIDNNGLSLNDGGIYDPSENSWQYISGIGSTETKFETYNARSIYYSQRPWIEGALFSGSSYNGSNGLIHKTVTLWGKEFRDPEWIKIGDITTGSWRGWKGLFGAEITGVRHNMYFYTSFTGDTTYAPSQSSIMRTVVKTRNTVGGRLYRRVFRVYGKIYPSKARRGVKVYIAKSGGRWRGYSARLDRYSRYHFDYRRRRGTYYYRVYYPGDVYNGRSWSSRRKIRIR